MFVDTITIIICAALFLLSIVSILANPFFRKLKSAKSDVIDSNNTHQLPQVSVLIVAQDNPDALQQTLSAVVAQEYPHDFEIIVVIEQGDLVAENIINIFAQNRKIYTTFVPKRSLFMSKEKLAVSLAVKAAHNEWIALLTSGCVPQTEQWLQTLASHCDDNVSIVTGYCNYDIDAPAFYRFLQLRSSLYLMRKAQHGTAFRANGYDILFRKSVFVNDDGYRGNLEYRYGVCDFIVNKYARKGNTVPVLTQSACVREKFIKKNWYNSNLHYIHNRKHFLGRMSFRLLYCWDLTLMYISYSSLIAAIVYSSLTKNVILLSVAIVMLILTIAIRMMMARNKLKRFGEPMSSWAIIPFELVLGWYDLILKLKYRMSDKNDFITHKL